ncbi:TlpA disulfide reductase family protein [Thalassotalea agariperforans]
MRTNSHYYQKLAVALLLLISALSLFSCSQEVADEPDPVVKNFEQQLKTYQGQVVYIDFWASWCIPCRQTFPWMNAMLSKYKAQGFKVITINLDSDKQNADDFLQQYPAQFEVVYDPKGKLAQKFNLKGMPSSYLVDRKGNVVSSHTGFSDEKSKAYEQEIIDLLAQK